MRLIFQQEDFLIKEYQSVTLKIYMLLIGTLFGVDWTPSTRDTGEFICYVNATCWSIIICLNAKNLISFRSHEWLLMCKKLRSSIKKFLSGFGFQVGCVDFK